MDINFSSLPSIIAWAAMLFFIYLLLYRKYIYSVIDPLFSWVFTTAFASVLVIQIVPTLKDTIHFFGCQIALYVGFAVGSDSRKETQKSENMLNSTYSFSNQLILRWVTYLLFVVYISSNLVIGLTKGFALLSDAPSEAKFANFQEGFGLFRKINWSTGTFVCTALIFLYLIKRKTIDLILLIPVVFFYSLEGSKSALLKIAIAVGTILYHPAFSSQQKLLKKFQHYLPTLFILIMSIFFTVLMKENNGLEESFIAFVRRLLYSADSILYFYTQVNLSYFEAYSFFDYFPRLINPILGFLRIQPYQEALGNIMYDNLRPPGSVYAVTVGPNAPFYIEGRIFFYYWGAFPYSIFVGYLYASLRSYFFSLTRVSSFHFVYMGCICQLASAIIVDVNLAVTVIFDLFFFVIPPYILVSLLLTRRVSVRFFSKYLRFTVSNFFHNGSN